MQAGATRGKRSHLTLVTDPLNRLLSQIFTFLPQLIGAAILLLVAWIIASLLRLIVTRVMSAARLDERIGGKFDAEKEKPLQLTKTIGDMVYWLIFLLFLPAVLGTLNLEGLLDPVQRMLDKFLGFLPNILAAAVIGVVGWFVARIVRQIVTSLLSAAGSDRLSDRVGIASISKLVGLIVYILILIPVLVAALNALGPDAITQPASSMLNLILEAMPAIFAASIVVVIAYIVGKIVAGFITELLTGIGLYLANLASKAIQSSASAQANLVSIVARVAILVQAGSIAMRYMGLANEIVNMAFGLVLGAIAVAAAIAFGIGGREVAARKLEEWIAVKKDK